MSVCVRFGIHMYQFENSRDIEGSGRGKTEKVEGSESFESRCRIKGHIASALRDPGKGVREGY